MSLDNKIHIMAICDYNIDSIRKGQGSKRKPGTIQRKANFCASRRPSVCLAIVKSDGDEV
jgi:hypothetical protein